MFLVYFHFWQLQSSIKCWIWIWPTAVSLQSHLDWVSKLKSDQVCLFDTWKLIMLRLRKVWNFLFSFWLNFSRFTENNNNWEVLNTRQYFMSFSLRTSLVMNNLWYLYKRRFQVHEQLQRTVTVKIITY